jgi:hypothetical protein
MVWIYRSLPVGRRGVIPRSNDFYLPPLRVEEGGGSAHCVQHVHDNLHVAGETRQEHGPGDADVPRRGIQR